METRQQQQKKKKKKKKGKKIYQIPGKQLLGKDHSSLFIQASWYWYSVCTIKQLRVPTPVQGDGERVFRARIVLQRLDLRRLGWISVKPTVDGPPNSRLARSASHPSLVDVSLGLLTLVH